jgi:hypothetical protein
MGINRDNSGMANINGYQGLTDAGHIQPSNGDHFGVVLELLS